MHTSQDVQSVQDTYGTTVAHQTMDMAQTRITCG